MRRSLPVPLALLAFVLVLVAPLAAPVRAGDGEETAEGAAEEMVFRTYDVSDLTAPRWTRIGPVLGMDHPLNTEIPLAVPEPRSFVRPDQLTEILASTVGPRDWSSREGALLQAGHGVLAVSAPPAVHRAIVQRLAELQAAASRRVLVSVRAFEGPAGGEAAATPLAESGSIEVPPGVRRALQVTNRIRFVADYDVEIAQGSNISNPTVVVAEEGLVADVVADPTLDGTRVVLEMILQRGRYDAPVRELDTALDEEYLPEPFRSPSRSRLGNIQLPAFREALAHVTAVVPSGGRVVMPFVVDGREVRLEVEARLLGSGPSDRYVELGSILRPPMGVFVGLPPEPSDDTHLFAPRLRPADEEPLFPGSADELLELLRRSNAKGIEDEGQALALLEQRVLLLAGGDDVRQRGLAFLAARESEALRPVVVDLRVLSVPGPVPVGPGATIEAAGAEVVAAAHVPTLANRPASILVGTTRNYVADYDVEVAQEARIADPVIGQGFGGLVANLRPLVSMDRSEVAVDLQLLASDLQISPEPFDSGAQFLGPIDRVEARRALVQTTVRVPANGVYVVDAGADPTRPDRRLAIEVRATLP